mmetsp:Transcript_26019/g.75352  ORF Transcript_26019/g.75352 Transcript_26019/m.75352 type:complete len:267 (+) Transcript_26019:1300-2100(+)
MLGPPRAPSCACSRACARGGTEGTSFRTSRPCWWGRCSTTEPRSSIVRFLSSARVPTRIPTHAPLPPRPCPHSPIPAPGTLSEASRASASLAAGSPNPREFRTLTRAGQGCCSSTWAAGSPWRSLSPTLRRRHGSRRSHLTGQCGRLWPRGDGPRPAPRVGWRRRQSRHWTPPSRSLLSAVRLRPSSLRSRAPPSPCLRRSPLRSSPSILARRAPPSSRACSPSSALSPHCPFSAPSRRSCARVAGLACTRASPPSARSPHSRWVR